MDDIRNVEKKLGGDGGVSEAAEEAASSTMRQANDAIEVLRGVVEQATTTLRDLGQAGGEWAQGAQERAREMAGQVRSQGEWAASTVARQVESYPLTSLLMAFGIGYCIGMLTRRSS